MPGGLDAGYRGINNKLITQLIYCVTSGKKEFLLQHHHSKLYVFLYLILQHWTETPETVSQTQAANFLVKHLY